MSEQVIQRILLLNQGDRLLVDRADKPGVIEIKSVSQGQIQFDLGATTHVIKLNHPEVSRTFKENGLAEIFGESPVMFFMSQNEDINTTID